MPTTGGSPSRSGAASASSTAQAKLSSSASGNAPPPTRATVGLDLSADETGQPFGPRSHDLAGLVQHPQHRDLAARARGVGVERERSLERGQPELVGAQRALERVAAQALDEVRAPEDDPRLRAAEQLVAREADEVGAARERVARRRLVPEVEQRAGAEVVDEGEPVARGDRCELAQLRPLLEPDEPEVRLVHAQQQRGLGPDRGLVVRRARPVRRPDLDQPRSRPGQHVGNAEAVADLDQLAARDDDLVPFRERGHREQHRGRVVVDDQRSLGAGQAAQELGAVILPRTARTGPEVVLQVRVAARRVTDALERGRRQRRAPEVRVHDHPGGVQHPPQLRPARAVELAPPAGLQVAGIGAGADLVPGLRDHGPRNFDSQRIVAPAGQLVHRREVAELHVGQV